MSTTGALPPAPSHQDGGAAGLRPRQPTAETVGVDAALDAAGYVAPGQHGRIAGRQDRFLTRMREQNVDGWCCARRPAHRLVWCGA